jgi:serine/threonine protein kinase
MTMIKTYFKHDLLKTYMASLAKYDIAKLLGKGSFGEVFLAQNKQHPEKSYAVKKIRDMVSDGYFDVVGIKEAEFYRVLQDHHVPGMVHVEESLIHPDNYNTYIVMEACMGGSLDGLLDKNEYDQISVQDRLTQWASYVGTFRDMHSLGIFHLDIKAENVLCRKENDIAESVICDGSNVVFTIQNLQQDLPSIPFVAASYRPPEFTTYTDIGRPDKADVWSLGILFLEIFGGGQFLSELDEECHSIAKTVQPELRRYRNLFLNKHKHVSGMHIAKDLVLEKDELNDRLWNICYIAGMLRRLGSENLWEKYLSKDKIYEKTNSGMVSLMKNLTNFIQKFVLTSSSTSRITSQQLYEVLEKNLFGKIPFAVREAPIPQFIHIAKESNSEIWPQDFFAKLFAKCATVQIYRGGVKQDVTPEFIYYAKALCDYYLQNISQKKETNLELTFGASLLLAGEVTCCDIRRKELIIMGLLPESNYEDLEQVLKSRIKKIYHILQGKMAYIVSN